MISVCVSVSALAAMMASRRLPAPGVLLSVKVVGMKVDGRVRSYRASKCNLPRAGCGCRLPPRQLVLDLRATNRRSGVSHMREPLNWCEPDTAHADRHAPPSGGGQSALWPAA